MEEFSAGEVAEWMTYAGIEPFGDIRADVRAGIIASIIANANRNPKKKPTPFTPQDFMPFLERSVATPSASPDTISKSIKQMFGHPSVKTKD